MIQDFKEFSYYKYKVSNENIFSSNLETGISGIKYDSKTLLILPRNENLKPINQYNNLEFVEFNNYDLNESEIRIISVNQNLLKKIKYLSFWNTKLHNLNLLEYFENIEVLNVAHISESKFTFDGIKNLKKLKTLCLLKTGKIKDLTSIATKSIENFSLIQPTNIKNTYGIDNLTELKYLNIEGSMDKVYSLEKLDGLDNLPSLEKVKFHKVNIPYEELIKALKLPLKIELDIDTNLYSTEQYKKLSLELSNVNSKAFNPYIEEDSYIQPIGKGKRIIKKSDKKFSEKKDKLIEEWNK